MPFSEAWVGLVSERQLEMEEESLRCGLRRRLDELVLANKKQEGMMQQILDKLECPVCLNIPRCGPVPVCPNGHFVCIKCKADSCPTCRTVMGSGKSLLASTSLENIEHKCKFDHCEEKFALGMAPLLKNAHLPLDLGLK